MSLFLLYNLWVRGESKEMIHGWSPSRHQPYTPPTPPPFILCTSHLIRSSGTNRDPVTKRLSLWLKKLPIQTPPVANTATIIEREPKISINHRLVPFHRRVKILLYNNRKTAFASSSNEQEPKGGERPLEVLLLNSKTPWLIFYTCIMYVQVFPLQAQFFSSHITWHISYIMHTSSKYIIKKYFL